MPARTNPVEPSKRPRRRRLLLLAVLLFVGLVIACIAGLAVHVFVDEPPSDVSDLTEGFEELPDEENGVVALALHHGDVFWPGRELTWAEFEELVGEPVTDESLDPVSDAFRVSAARVIVERNADVLARLEKAVELPFQFSQARTFFSHGGAVSEMRRLANVLACRARIALERGDVDGACTNALLVFRFGERIVDPRATLLPFVSGMAVQDLAVDLLNILIAREDNPPGTLRHLLDSLPASPVADQAFAEALRSGYAALARSVDEVATEFAEGAASPVDHIVSRASLRPNETRRLAAEATRALIEEVDGPPRGRRGPGRAEDLAPKGLLDGLRNSTGKSMAGSLYSLADIAFRARDTLRARTACLRTVIALRLYHLERGGLPETLEALVPDLLDAMPLDPLDGEPLRYSREKGIVYSVGNDFTDTGGSQSEDESYRSKDPTEPTFVIRLP